MRLFIAVNLPDDVRSDVWRATHELRQRHLPVRWVHAELLHVTVKFLGDVESTRIGDIEKGLAEAAADARSHSVAIEGMGAFPSLRRPQTLWAGCEATPAMELLQHGVEKRCAALGFPVEGRPFRPHVTIGRVKRGTRPRETDGLGEELEQIRLNTVALVTSIDLMESQLGRSGPRYRVLRAFELGS